MFATLGFNELVRVPPGMEVSFRALRAWLDSWKGIGDIEAGMRRQGYDLSFATTAEGGARRSTSPGWNTASPHHGLSVGADAVESGPARRRPNPGPDRAIRRGRL